MMAVLLIPELLERIFALLSRKDMKAAVLVCKWGINEQWTARSHMSYDGMFQEVVDGGVFPYLLVLGWADCHQLQFPSHPTGGQWTGFGTKHEEKEVPKMSIISKITRCFLIWVKTWTQKWQLLLVKMPGASCTTLFLSQVSFPWGDSTQYLVEKSFIYIFPSGSLKFHL